MTELKKLFDVVTGSNCVAAAQTMVSAAADRGPCDWHTMSNVD